MHGGGNLCGNTSVVFKEAIRTKLISVECMRSPSERTYFNVYVKKTNQKCCYGEFACGYAYLYLN